MATSESETRRRPSVVAVGQRATRLFAGPEVGAAERMARIYREVVVSEGSVVPQRRRAADVQPVLVFQYVRTSAVVTTAGHRHVRDG